MAASGITDVQRVFEGIRPDPSWAFAELTQKHTNYATHGYHRYPAKFIPQLVARLIQEYSSEGGLVVDPFMGSGTTLVEAKLLRRPSVGVDINPVAHLIAQAKTQAIEPGLLTRAVAQLREAIPDPAQPTLFRDTPNLPVSSAAWHERLRYWFAESTLQQLNQIQCAIEALDSDSLRTFFRCALSHTLKTVSYWHDRSVKPMRKLGKPIPDAREAFFRQVQRMLRGNYEFWQLLCERNALETPATPYCADARALPVETESAQLVATSPPYVTSYEYADLHQLSALWFRWTTNLRAFRAGFIGRSNGLYTETDDLHSRLAERIVERIGEVSVRKAREVALYFAEMWECFKEVHRVLQRGGYACIVIGNTHLCEVEVQNAQVFAEQLQTLGFAIERVILREIPSKILPQTRDKTTGKFARTQDADYTAYPTEYILIAQRR